MQQCVRSTRAERPTPKRKSKCCGSRTHLVTAQQTLATADGSGLPHSPSGRSKPYFSVPPFGRSGEPSLQKLADDVFLETSDGVQVHGWYLNQGGGEVIREGQGPAVILYFHGNAGSLAGRFHWMEALGSLGMDVFGLDYRGYGRSEGSPGEEGFYLDGEAAMDYLAEVRGVPSHRVLVYGKSLGGGTACEIAARYEVWGLVLQSTFTSLPDMASAFIPFVPSGPFLAGSYDNLEKVKSLEVPKLIIHSRDDDLIPFWMGEMLYQEASEPKRFLQFSGSGHNDLIVRERKGIIRGFRELVGGGS